MVAIDRKTCEIKQVGYTSTKNSKWKFTSTWEEESVYTISHLEGCDGSLAAANEGTAVGESGLADSKFLRNLMFMTLLGASFGIGYYVSKPKRSLEAHYEIM